MEGDLATVAPGPAGAFSRAISDDRVRSDSELVLGIAEGRPGAMAEVYERHRAAVRGLACRLCGAVLAEDVTQEVFFALWRTPELFDAERGSLRTYLLNKTRGKAIDQVRSAGARRARELTTAGDTPHGFDVEQEVLASLAGEELWESLSRLPEGKRQAVLLAYFGHYTYRQVATLLHQPEGTVKSHIRSALSQLRDILTTDDGPTITVHDAAKGAADLPGTKDPTEFTLILAQIARTLFSAGSTAATLQGIVGLARDTIVGCVFAGIFMVNGDEAITPAYTDPVVVEIDSFQQLAGEGPCLDAITQESTFYADDLVDDTRWPTFAPQAVSAGVRCMFALRLSSNGANRTLGTLNLYARHPGAFGATDRAKAVILATLAGLALGEVEAHEAEECGVAHLHPALATRTIISQAQSILMECDGITLDQAFDTLRRASQHLNVKLRDASIPGRLVADGPHLMVDRAATAAKTPPGGRRQRVGDVDLGPLD